MSESKSPGYKHVAYSEIAAEDGRVELEKENIVRPALYSILAGLGAFMFGYTLGFTSPALPAMYGQNSAQVFTVTDCNDSNISSQTGSLFSSIVNIGAVFGAMVAGRLADYIGRKFALASAAIPLVAGWVWLAMVRDPTQAILSRAMAGVGVGMCSSLTPMYISEIAPTAYRGALGALNQLLITVGDCCPEEKKEGGGGMDKKSKIKELQEAKSQIREQNDRNLWRVFYRLLTATRRYDIQQLPKCNHQHDQVANLLPETPVYLLKIGQTQRACTVMKKMSIAGRHPDSNRLSVNDDIGGANDGGEPVGRFVSSGSGAGGLEHGDNHAYDDDDDQDGSSSVSFGELCSEESRMPMIIGCGLMLLQQWSGNNAVIFFCSSIFKTAGLDNTDQASLYVMATQVIATGLSVYLMDKAGRRLLMLMASVGMAAASGTLGFLFLLQHGSQKPPGWITIIALITYIIFFSIGMGPIPWLITGEIFPNRTRALGSSVATMVNWFSAFGVTFLFADMEESLQDYGTFWFYTSILGFAFIFVFILVPETKGLSNWEIQLALKRKNPFGERETSEFKSNGNFK
eukprot:jgi/Bigna1/88116/estExt_fgenesh1_pg.C_280098